MRTVDSTGKGLVEWPVTQILFDSNYDSTVPTLSLFTYLYTIYVTS